MIMGPLGKAISGHFDHSNLEWLKWFWSFQMYEMDVIEWKWINEIKIDEMDKWK